MQHTLKPPAGVKSGQGASGKQFAIDPGTGLAKVDADSVASLVAKGWSVVTSDMQLTGQVDANGHVTGLTTPDGNITPLVTAAVPATGSASAALGANSPATVPTAPYKWLTVTLPDGTTGFVPVWK